MNKFYYFSESKLKFVEIKNFPKKLLLLFSISVLIFTSILFGIYLFISSFQDSKSEIASLKAENEELANKLEETLSLYKVIQENLKDLAQSNNELRISADLPVISEEERMLGTGGSTFDEIFSSSRSKVDLTKLSNYLDNIRNKVESEKLNYLEVSKKLKLNKELYASIPALKPCDGILAQHGFGMRMHPILGYKRMHEGIDIMTPQGTPVKASGKGVIDFLGRKGGLGLCIEIDHGFGYRTVFGHLSSTNVKLGQKISRGQIIAKTGNTGLSSGPHLHYEVQHNGEKLDPIDFLFDDLEAFDLSPKN